jgi:hypothetical protein
MTEDTCLNLPIQFLIRINYIEHYDNVVTYLANTSDSNIEYHDRNYW